MDQEIVLQQLDNLGNKLEHLVKTCRRLENENKELIKQKQELALQLEEKIASQKKQDELKDLIRSKIDSLMGRLDEFAEA